MFRQICRFFGVSNEVKQSKEILNLSMITYQKKDNIDLPSVTHMASVRHHLVKKHL